MHRLPEPYTCYRLTEEERRQVASRFEPGAVEHYLQWIPEGMRAEHFSYFIWQQGPEPPRSTVPGSTRLPSLSAIVYASDRDPVLQSALTEIWAPTFDHIADSQLEQALRDMPPEVIKEVGRRRRKSDR